MNHYTFKIRQKAMQMNRPIPSRYSLYINKIIVDRKTKTKVGQYILKKRHSKIK